MKAALLLIGIAGCLGQDLTYSGKYEYVGYCVTSQCSVETADSEESLARLLETAQTCANSDKTCFVTVSVDVSIPLSLSPYGCATDQYIGVKTSGIHLPTGVDVNWVDLNFVKLSPNLATTCVSPSFSGWTSDGLSEICSPLAEAAPQFNGVVLGTELHGPLGRDFQIPLRSGAEDCSAGKITYPFYAPIWCHGECRERDPEADPDPSNAQITLTASAALIVLSLTLAF